MISILYVDDDEAFCNLSKLFLEKTEDFSVTTVRSGREAVQIALSDRYDVIISDYHMPGMDGIELLKMYRKKGGTAPFILFTGKGREEVVVEAINNGAAFYLQKGGDSQPLFAELSHKIRQAVARVSAERLVIENEEKYRLLFETARDGILLLSDKKVKDCNPQAAILFGTTRNELLGTTLATRSPEIQPDKTLSREKEDTIFLSAERDGSVFTRWYFTRTDKTGFHAEVSISTLKIRGSILFQAVIHDITDQLKAQEELEMRNIDLSTAYEELMASGEELQARVKELRDSQEALKESEEKYRELADLLPGGVFECTPEGLLTYVNHEGLIMFGYDQGTDLRDLSVFQFLYPDDHKRASEVLKSVLLSTNQTSGHEYRVVRQDGTIFPSIVRSSPIFRSGKIIGLRGVIIDISDQKKAEEAIRESQQRFSDVIEFLPDATLVVSREGKVISWNRAMSELTGVDADEMLGKGNYEYSIPFYGERRAILVDMALNPKIHRNEHYNILTHEGDVIIGETSVPMIKGGSAYLWGKASPLRNSSGEIIGAIESIRDFTKWKETELALIKAHDELEGKILERTAELFSANTALRESEERHRILVEFSPGYNHWFMTVRKYFISIRQVCVYLRLQTVIRLLVMIYSILFTRIVNPWLSHGLRLFYVEKNLPIR